MKPIYKRVRQLVPHCPTCEQELEGNGSLAFPYTCACGIWEYQWTGNSDYDYAIKIKSDDSCKTHYKQ